MSLSLISGYATAKGELVRSILFPTPADFKFTQDAYKFIGVLAGISMIGMIYTLVIMVRLMIYTLVIMVRLMSNRKGVKSMYMKY